MQRLENKKGFEMSINTIVVLVIGVTMLILGLVLVKSIMGGATQNVDAINEKMKGEIDKLFSDETQKSALYLSKGIASIKQGETYGVAFAIKNVNSKDSTFSYNTTVTTPTSDLQSKCDMTSTEALDLISQGKSDTDIELGSGEAYYTIIRFQPDLGTPLCLIRYRVEIKEGIRAYSTFNFDIQIKAK